MIEGRNFIAEIRNFQSKLLERCLLIDSNEPVVSEYYDAEEGGYFYNLDWNARQGLSYLFGDFLSLPQYLMILEKRDYLFLFSDYSLLQVDIKFDADDRIYKHRLCYLPSPISYDEGLVGYYSMRDYIDVLSPSELMDNVKLVTPVRFDFDINMTDEKHAHSHMTINKDTCRIPGYGPVSLGHFFKFVMRYFYEDSFEALNWESIRPKVTSRTMTGFKGHEFFFESNPLHG